MRLLVLLKRLGVQRLGVQRRLAVVLANHPLVLLVLLVLLVSQLLALL